MNIRHLATKGSDGRVELSRSYIYEGTPVVLRLDSQQTEEIFGLESQDETLQGLTQHVKEGVDEMRNGPLGDVIFDDDDSVFSLSSLFDYKVGEGSELSEEYPVGSSFDTVFESDVIQNYMRSLATKMYPGVLPNTGKQDIDESSYYAPYVPITSVTGCIPAQVKDGNAYFNPEGTVTVAEFLDSINAIRYGSNSNASRRKSIDNISTPDDYFNEGYVSCLSGISSPFFNLYTRKELMQPITRLELAYIIVLCWTPYVEKYNAKYGNAYYLGVNLDWNKPGKALRKYKDGLGYKVSRIKLDNEFNVISLNIKDYKGDRSMTEYKADLKSGKSAIPLPMLMSLAELGAVNMFYFEDNRLDPMRELSRGELAYFTVHLAKLFPVMYVKEA